MTIPSFHTFLVTESQRKQQRRLVRESWLSSLITWLRQKLSSLFKGLGFGQKKSMSIPLESLTESVILERNVAAAKPAVAVTAADVAQSKALLGYYSEIRCAEALSGHIAAHGGRLTTTSTQKHFAGLAQQYLTKISHGNVAAGELTRIQQAGDALGKSIWEDILIEGEDLNLLTFDIELTGTSAKGKSKADIVLTVTKDKESVIVDRLAASLKAYKTANINLANTTFVSFIRRLFYDADHPSSSTEEFIEQFIRDHGGNKSAAIRKKMEQLYAHQQIIITKMDAGKSKPDARKAAKLTHGEVIEIISSIFAHAYANPKNKKKINERMLKLIGLESDEDFYAAIGTSKTKIISSRRSPELKQLIQRLREGFTIQIERVGETNSAAVNFYAPNKELILSGRMTFADTGGERAQGKTNLFINFNKI